MLQQRSWRALTEEHADETAPKHCRTRTLKSRKNESVSPFFFSPPLFFSAFPPLLFSDRRRETPREARLHAHCPGLLLFDMQLPQATGVAAQRGGPLAPKALPRKPTTRGVAAARSTSTTASDVGPATASLATSDTPKPLKKVAMVSLGCPKNTVDGEIVFDRQLTKSAESRRCRAENDASTLQSKSSRRTKGEKLERVHCFATRTRSAPLPWSFRALCSDCDTRQSSLDTESVKRKSFREERERERKRESMGLHGIGFFSFPSLLSLNLLLDSPHRRRRLQKKKKPTKTTTTKRRGPPRRPSRGVDRL